MASISNSIRLLCLNSIQMLQKPPTPALGMNLRSDNPFDWLLGSQFRKKKQSCTKIPPPIPSMADKCREPLKTVIQAEYQKLDPMGARKRLFEKYDPDAIHVRDIVMVKTQSSDPFSGVVMRIQRKHHDSSVRLRNTVKGIGIEREFKIFSPTVTGIEVVQKRKKIPVQSRLFYLRQPTHDVGSVDNIVDQYLKKKRALGTSIKIVAKSSQQPTKKPSKRKR